MSTKKRINSRQKGAAGERELANYLKARGFEAARGQQFKGGGESPDVVGLPGFHIEAKRVEAGNPYNWLEQAKRDTPPTEFPIVMHRRSRHNWIVVMELDDFLLALKRILT